jgi:hypothetical protein
MDKVVGHQLSKSRTVGTALAGKKPRFPTRKAGLSSAPGRRSVLATVQMKPKLL